MIFILNEARLTSEVLLELTKPLGWLVNSRNPVLFDLLSVVLFLRDIISSTSSFHKQLLRKRNISAYRTFRSFFWGGGWYTLQNAQDICQAAFIYSKWAFFRKQHTETCYSSNKTPWNNHMEAHLHRQTSHGTETPLRRPCQIYTEQKHSSSRQDDYPLWFSTMSGGWSHSFFG